MTNNYFLFELHSYSSIDIIGKDSDRFLQGQLTVNVEHIKGSTAILAALCNPKGRIVSLFHITKINDGYRLFMPKSITEPSLTHLNKYAVFFKVTVKSAASLNKLYVFNNNQQGKSNALLKDEFAHNVVNIQSTTLAIITSTDQINRLINNDPPIAQQKNDSDWYWILAEHNIPWLNQDTIEQFLPHNLNLPKLGAVDFNKGCFTGQEIIARMQYKGKLKQTMQRLKTNHSLSIKPKEAILQNEKKIGEVICSINVEGKGSIMLALLKNSFSKNENIQLTDENSSILKLIE